MSENTYTPEQIEAGAHLSEDTVESIKALLVKADNGVKSARVQAVIMAAGTGPVALAKRFGLSKQTWSNVTVAVGFIEEHGETGNTRVYAPALSLTEKPGWRAAFDATDAGMSFARRVNAAIDAANAERRERTARKGKTAAGDHGLSEGADPKPDTAAEPVQSVRDEALALVKRINALVSLPGLSSEDAMAIRDALMGASATALATAKRTPARVKATR